MRNLEKEVFSRLSERQKLLFFLRRPSLFRDLGAPSFQPVLPTNPGLRDPQLWHSQGASATLPSTIYLSEAIMQNIASWGLWDPGTLHTTSSACPL